LVGGTRATYAPDNSAASGSEATTADAIWYTRMVYRSGVPRITIGQAFPRPTPPPTISLAPA